VEEHNIKSGIEIAFLLCSNVCLSLSLSLSLSVCLSVSAPLYLSLSLSQTFCRTEKVLTPGMCGGIAVGKRGSICGMVEGIVPKEHPKEILRDLGVIIETPEILR
jgi:hypothetical protein